MTVWSQPRWKGGGVKVSLPSSFNFIHLPTAAMDAWFSFRDSVDMYTTVVPSSLEGRGIAKLLANQAFQYARCIHIFNHSSIIHSFFHSLFHSFIHSFIHDDFRDNKLSMKLSCWYLSGYLKRSSFFATHFLYHSTKVEKSRNFILRYFAK